VSDWGRMPEYRPWRKVIDSKRHYVPRGWSFGKPNASSLTLQLECGHDKIQGKGSKPVPRKVRCDQCPRVKP
jgi:hypothetical protein